ncbi:MAG: hypothetical protein ICV74_01870 [Thermoleophilia bacterium]|nr:hypothetical protein [Thermoleophilia bacterium]
MRPDLPQPVERATERIFSRLSGARRRRIFHPRGIAYRVSIEVGDGVPGTRALPPGARLSAVARFSRGLGLPRGVPDFLGLALGLETDQDLLLATSAMPPGLRFLPLPATSFFGRLFSSLLPLAAGGRLLLVGARVHGADHASGGDTWDELGRAAGRGPIRLDLLAARPRGAWRPIARAETCEQLTPEEAQRVVFDAWRCGGGLVPWGAVNRLRAPAYRGSRRGRAAARGL